MPFINESLVCRFLLFVYSVSVVVAFLRSDVGLTTVGGLYILLLGWLTHAASFFLFGFSL